MSIISTRCNLIIEDDHNRIQLYRHCDGYPDGPCGVLVALREAIPYAWPNPRFEAADFAAAIVRAWKEGGGNIYIDGSPKAWEMIHGDVEWVYLVKPKKRDRDTYQWTFIGPPVVEVYDWHRY